MAATATPRNIPWKSWCVTPVSSPSMKAPARSSATSSVRRWSVRSKEERTDEIKSKRKERYNPDSVGNNNNCIINIIRNNNKLWSIKHKKSKNTKHKNKQVLINDHKDLNNLIQEMDKKTKGSH